METFFAYDGDWNEKEILIRDDEAKHLIDVLRRKIGDRITVTNGKGVLWKTEIRSIEKKKVRCSILETHYNVNELTTTITLAIALLKNPGRFDFVIEKATEMGVKHIVPFHSARTIAKSDHRERWERIARAAMKQCCRSVVPSVSPVQTFSEVLSLAADSALALCPHEKAPASNTLFSFIASHPAPASVVVCIGPEGGFTDDEIEEAEARGYQLVSLGTRRLRSETAALVAVSQLVGAIER